MAQQEEYYCATFLVKSDELVTCIDSFWILEDQVTNNMNIRLNVAPGDTCQSGVWSVKSGGKMSIIESILFKFSCLTGIILTEILVTCVMSACEFTDVAFC